MSPDHMRNSAGVFEGQHRIVVLAPHPDDESLACGTLLARAFAGAGAHVICLTDGSASHPGSRQWPACRLAQRRKAELIQALSRLGGSARDLTWLGMADSRLYQVDPASVAADLVKVITDNDAQHIFAPAAEDHHADHKATAHIASEIRKLRPDWAYYSYPVWSRWDDPEFDRNITHRTPRLVESGDWRERKQAAINAHQSQLGAVIKDDPAGFILPPDFIEKFVTEDEVFWRMS